VNNTATPEMAACVCGADVATYVSGAYILPAETTTIDLFVLRRPSQAHKVSTFFLEIKTPVRDRSQTQPQFQQFTSRK
jgi:hypothetical protein